MQPDRPIASGALAFDAGTLPPVGDSQAEQPPVKSGSFSEEDLSRTAAGFETALPSSRVSTQGDRLVFSPTWDSAASVSCDDLAYCIYRLHLQGYGDTTREQTLGLAWESAAQEFYLGFLGETNQHSEYWEWYAGPEDGVLTIESFAPYQDAGGDVLIIVVVLGTEECVLDSMEVGAWEVRGLGADLDALSDDVLAIDPPDFWSELMPPMEVDLSADCSPVRDQGGIQSCAAFAIGDGAFNYELGQVYGWVGWDFDHPFNLISPRWLYVVNGWVQQSPCPYGTRSPWHMAKWMKTYGSATEYNVPYGSLDASLFECTVPLSQAVLDDTIWLKLDDMFTIASKHPVTDNWYLSDSDIADVKTVLSQQRRPVIFSTPLDDQFSTPDYSKGEVWIFNGNNVGGHSMLIVGYSEAIEAFYVRNSWGENWGHHGHCWIGYESLKRGDTGNFCMYIVHNYRLEVAQRFCDERPPLLAVAALAAMPAAPSGIKLEWEPVEGAVRYSVHRDLRDNVIGSVSAPETSFIDESVDDEFTHVYWVRPTDGSDNGPWSPPVLGWLGME